MKYQQTIQSNVADINLTNSTRILIKPAVFNSIFEHFRTFNILGKRFQILAAKKELLSMPWYTVFTKVILNWETCL